jgi:RNA polymerase sigma-70 factor (ECF subfamily)
MSFRVILEAMPRMSGRRVDAEAPAAPLADAEAGLVARAQRGDESAFALLMDRHLDRIWGLVWRVMRHREDTEDVVQEAFLAAWRALPGFRGEARFSTWLQTIAVSRALNHRARGSERVRRASSPFAVNGDPSFQSARAVEARGAGASGAPSPGEPADDRPGASPLRLLESAELRMRLASCLEKLPAEWRAVLALREGERSLSYEEIATTLGLALGTVRSRLARARLSLRDCVEGEA